MKRIITAIALAGMIMSCNDNEKHRGEHQAFEEQKATMKMNSGALKSATVLEFHENILFVGDSNQGKIYAFETEKPTETFQGATYNMKDFSNRIASFLNVSKDDFLIKDLAVHPMTGEAYVAVSVIVNNQYVPVIIKVNPKGDLMQMDLDTIKSTSLQLKDTNGKEFKFWNDESKSSQNLSITDLDFYKGKLYISGMNNTDFASALRVADYPFTGNAAVAITDIYHTVHDQQETKAPIRTMLITELDGKDYVLAAYTCTPLVLFPLDEIKDGAKISGKTIAELGYGNTPVDLLAYKGQDMEQNTFDVFLLNNKNRSAYLMTKSAVENAAKGKGLTTQEMFGKAGVDVDEFPMTNIMQMADLDPYHLLTLRRNMDNGNIELVSYLKNLYFRLSDFESEYDVPGYEYPESQKMMRDIQNIMRKDEGHEEFVR